MDSQAVVHSTFAIERHFPKTPEAVFGAFTDVHKKRRWFAEGEQHDIEVFDMDFRVGGVERFQYRFKDGAPFPGVVINNEGTYHDIVPNRRIVLASSMTITGKRVSTSLITIQLLQTGTGTNVILTHQGAFYEGSDGLQIRESGWRTVLDRLAADLG